MADSQSSIYQLAPEEVISAYDGNGKKVAICNDYTLAADEGCNLSKAAEDIAKRCVAFACGNAGLVLAENYYPLVLQIRGKSLCIKDSGEVVADTEWSKEAVEFAKLIGEHFAGFYDIAVENARLRERIAELESQSQIQASSDERRMETPVDFWKFAEAKGLSLEGEIFDVAPPAYVFSSKETRLAWEAWEAAQMPKAQAGVRDAASLGSFDHAKKNGLVPSPFGWLPNNLQVAGQIRTSDVYALGAIGAGIVTSDEIPQAQADARDAESDYQRGYRHGYNRRDAEVQGALL